MLCSVCSSAQPCQLPLLTGLLLECASATATRLTQHACNTRAHMIVPEGEQGVPSSLKVLPLASGMC